MTTAGAPSKSASGPCSRSPDVARPRRNLTGTCVRPATIVMTLYAASVAAGCATFDPPRPWQKGDLVRPSMRFDADPLAAKAAQHIYQSKEGAAGGGAVGGGGCGCN